MASINIPIQYKPGPLTRAMRFARRLGIRFPRWFIVWAMQHSGHVRVGSGPWMLVCPNLPLRGPR